MQFRAVQINLFSLDRNLPAVPGQRLSSLAGEGIGSGQQNVTRGPGPHHVSCVTCAANRCRGVGDLNLHMSPATWSSVLVMVAGIFCLLSEAGYFSPCPLICGHYLDSVVLNNKYSATLMH